MNTKKTIIVMAGGTGGHIMPGLAVAQQLIDAGHKVEWLGGLPSSMEARLVPQHGLTFHSVDFGGVRGKGVLTQLYAPIRLIQAMMQARSIMKKLNPDVVLGMGGYITVPGGLAAKSCGVPIVLHEQNSVAGLSNKLLAKIATTVITGFPNVFKNGLWLGNPVKASIAAILHPKLRFAQREGTLKVAVIGGSLGAQALNRLVPQALALLPPECKMAVVHQAGEKMLDDLRNNYALAQVEGECVPFVHDMAALYSEVDVVICRAGAMTVSELAVAGVASILVPFPSAVDDHQTSNAKLLTEVGAGICIQQNILTPQTLADVLYAMSREKLLAQSVAALGVAKPDATAQVAQACLDAAVKS